MSSVPAASDATEGPGGEGEAALAPAAGRTRRRWAGPAVVGLLAACLLALLVYGVASRGQSSGVDDRLARGESAPAPGFSGALLAEAGSSWPRDGRLARALASGRLDDRALLGVPYVLNFWASWCPPCAAESSTLNAGWTRARSLGVAIIGLDSLDNSGDARRFLSEHAVGYPTVHDASNLVAGRWKVPGFPETFFVSAGGRIVGHVIGPLSPQQLSRGTEDAIRGQPEPARQGAGSAPAPSG